jgi:4-amino-4-deoxy-L-arabinose transferase-like glycosyltransferase
MHYVSIIVEFLRGRPLVVFWTAALAQAAIWFVVPSLFYSAPPSGLANLLAVGREFQLGSYLGPPLAFWLGEISFRLFGIFGVYLLAQACVVTALWAVFQLGIATVGLRHAGIAVLLMAGILVLGVSSADFGPAVLAMPLWALALLHFWRAVGERNRGFWLLTAFELGLLLLTSYSAVILIGTIVIFCLSDPRARNSFRYLEPWIAILFVLFIAAPYVAWLVNRSELGLATMGMRGLILAPTDGLLLVIKIVALHIGLFLLVAVASGWPGRRRELPPVIDGKAADSDARRFIYFFALMPPLLAAVVVAVTGIAPALGQLAPLVLLSGLAAVTLARGQIKLYRERIVSFAWLGLLVGIPALTVLVMALAPWITATQLEVSQPANAMGRYFSESFERRTGRKLEYVAGDKRLASIVALAAPSRPAVFLDATPDLSPWANPERIREKGGILVWPASDTAGTAPAALREKFPGLVAEVPRVFERPVQGRLPLLRIGWAVIRPAALAASPTQPR